MQNMTAGYQSLSLLVRLNWDRIFYTAAIVGALLGAAALATAIN